MFAIKAEVTNREAEAFDFRNQKTMNGGKYITKGDPMSVCASENEGGPGLMVTGLVT